MNLKIKIISVVCAFVLFVIMILQGEKIIFSLIVSVTLSVMLYFIYLKFRQNKEKEKSRSYEMDLPDLMIHIAMFTEAGLNIQEAIERAVLAGNCKNMLYKDLRNVFESVRKGIYGDFVTALENMANERKSAVFSNFCSVIVQNLRKGSCELSSLFTTQAQIYRAERKRIAGKLADEASSLMLLPSTIVLIAMIILLLAPAVIEMGIGI